MTVVNTDTDKKITYSSSGVKLSETIAETKNWLDLKRIAEAWNSLINNETVELQDGTKIEVNEKEPTK